MGNHPPPERHGSQSRPAPTVGSTATVRGDDTALPGSRAPARRRLRQRACVLCLVGGIGLLGRWTGGQGEQRDGRSGDRDGGDQQSQVMPLAKAERASAFSSAPAWPPASWATPSAPPSDPSTAFVTVCGRR
jgi:hypothetical protein